MHNNASLPHKELSSLQSIIIANIIMLILITEISFHCNVGPKQPISIIVKPFGIF